MTLRFIVARILRELIELAECSVSTRPRLADTLKFHTGDAFGSQVFTFDSHALCRV